MTETSSPDFIRWYRHDQVVRSWLLGSLSEEVLPHVYHLTSSYEVALAKHFNHISTSRQFELQKKLQTITKQDKTMAEYLREFKSICDQLSSIGLPVSENMKIYGVLHDLEKEYEFISTVIESSMKIFPGQLYEYVVSQFTGFDDRLQSYNVSSGVTLHLAFATTQSYTPNYSNRGRGQFETRFGNNRGRGNYSTRGRWFYQLIQNTWQGFSSNNDYRPTY